MSGQIKNNPQDKAGDENYYSAADKKRYTNYVGIFCIGFFLAQFIIPMLVMMSFMPSMMSGMMRNIQPQGGASWQNRIWYLEKGPVNEGRDFFKNGPGPFTQTLKYLDHTSQADPTPVDFGALDLESPFLLGNSDRLWIISSSYIGFIDESGRVTLADDFVLGNISHPFIFENKPAVIEEHPAGYSLMVFQDSAWQDIASFKQDKGDNSCCFLANLRMVSNDDRPLLFLRQGGALFYRDSLPDDSETGRGNWQTVANIGSNWDAVMLNGIPAVFYQEKQQDMSSSKIVGLQLVDGNWQEFFSHPVGLITDFGVYPFSDGSFALLRSGFPGSLSVISVDTDSRISEFNLGTGSFFPKDMMLAMMTPQLAMMLLSFTLALIFTSLMSKYRVRTFQFGAMVIPYASLAKRAIAQVVDALIMGSPLLLGWLSLMDSFSDSDMFPGAVFSGFSSGIGLMMIGFIWVLTCLFLFSFMEGMWGTSPGKWLVGIRVMGTDLSPCGFGRAIIRNLLKFVDGFFNFIVGIMIVALSENWQRIGDMAARTVVVDIKQAGKSELPELPVVEAE